MNIGAPYVVITDEEVAQVDASTSYLWALPWEGAPEFQALYPGAHGIAQLSRVGFNSCLDQAVVYVDYAAASDFATGIYYVLQKSTAGWLVTFQEIEWQ
jgi:hypothetical protein